MNIMFMTKFPDGTPTDFVSKICQSFFNVSGEFHPYRIAKLHTIRRSKRIKKGMRLSMRYWKEKPYRSPQVEFAESECISTQDITIFRVHGKVRVWVDNNLIADDLLKRLAINDGFSSLGAFIVYFQKGFIGQIIHWTNLRY